MRGNVTERDGFYVSETIRVGIKNDDGTWTVGDSQPAEEEPRTCEKT